MSLAAFLNPLFLWGAALFAVPLIIHLINRRRYRTVTWAAMEFLLQAYKKKNRRMRVENLLLLLLRCAIPVLLAFALARPFLGSENVFRFMAEQRRDVVMLIDESYSMNRQVAAGTVFDAAKAQARRLFDMLNPDRGDTCSIVAMGAEPRILVRGSRLRQDWELALTKLERPQYRRGELVRAIEIIEGDVLPNLGGAAELFVLSDFQRNTFEPVFAETEDLAENALPEDHFGGMEDRVRELKKNGTSFHFINLVEGRLPPQNSTVVDLRCAEDTVIQHQNVRFTATVVNRGPSSPSSGSGRFLFGDSERPVTFEFDRDGQAIVEMYASFSTPGDHSVRFQLDEDDLLDDNSRSLRVAIHESIPLLIVDGDPGGADELDGEVRDLLLVLDPMYGQFDGDTFQRFFEPQWMTYHEFNRGKFRLDEYAAVILANVPEIDEARMVGELNNYVQRGGRVWFFLGDRVVAESYNTRLFRADGSGLLPYPLQPEPIGELAAEERRDAATAFARLQIADELSPMVLTFIDERRRRYIGTPIFRYLPFDTSVPATSQTTTVLEFVDSEEPALVNHRVGRGNVVWWVTSADDDWSLFPRVTAAYFPLIWDIANYLVAGDSEEHQLTVGAAIRKSVPFVVSSYTVTTPDGTQRNVTSNVAEAVFGHFPLAPFDDTGVPGIYEVEVTLDRGTPIRELFAVNVDPQEGELEALDFVQLSSLLDPQLFDYAAEISSEVTEQEPERRGEIWRSLMTILFAMLLLETVLAWRFGAYS